MLGLAGALAGALAEHAYGIVPTHPGFDDVPRPDRFDSMADLAEAYLGLLDELDLRDVMVIGNSVVVGVAVVATSGGGVQDPRALVDSRCAVRVVGHDG